MSLLSCVGSKVPNQGFQDHVLYSTLLSFLPLLPMSVNLLYPPQGTKDKFFYKSEKLGKLL